MTGPHSRGGRQATTPTTPSHHVHAPHAALLIDFDNVTMGIRSDLTKELKSLLNSEIIRGKVTVQRAYADWRRYPQYVMPLTERSIDMIWATAVGSTKKNATDIRLAIDAIELVFTRPEIGTFIILSGDSDFSSLVLKLKEYGKYVIGIGIRESASDLLIQNCDEYYSYSELAGLNREVDGPSVQRDPWELVRDAVATMVKNGDVMRSDRLKQVMQQIDSNFDERNAGFNRFSKFVAEAGNKGLLTLTKLDNGQFEVGPGQGAPTPTRSEAAAPAAGDGQRQRDRERDKDDGRRGRRGGRDRDRDRGRRDQREPRPSAETAPPKERPSAPESRPDQLTLGSAFALMTRALGELPNPARHDALRARMAALHGREDPMLDPERFPRLLRQANDAEIAEVRKAGDDGYEVSLSRAERARAASNGGSPAPASPAPLPESAAAPNGAGGEPSAEPAARSTLRFRRGSRVMQRPPEIPLVGMVDIEAPKPVQAAEPAAEAPPADAAPAKAGRGRGTRGKKGPAKGATEATPPAASTEPVTTDAKAAGAKPAGRGRGRGKAPRKA